MILVGGGGLCRWVPVHVLVGEEAGVGEPMLHCFFAVQAGAFGDHAVEGFDGVCGVRSDCHKCEVIASP
jgi:hypothetical protein